MKTVAVASTRVLTAVAVTTAAWAQATQAQAQPRTLSRLQEVNAALPSTPYASERGPVIAVTPFVQPVLVARRSCNDDPVAAQRRPLAFGASDNGVHANAGWLVTTQTREDRGRGVQTQAQALAQAAPAGNAPPPQHPRAVHQTIAATVLAHDERVDCESAYPQFDSGLVLDVFIGYGARHGVPRHDGRGGRLT